MKSDLALADCPVPAVHRAPSRRRVLRTSAVGNAEQAIGPITSGCEIFALTDGQFSIIDIVEHCLNTIGPASMDIATWTAADGDLRRAHAFLLSSTVSAVRFVVDPSFRSRKPEFCETLTSLFGSECIRTVPLHGKFVVLRNANFSLAIRTSMNLNVNNRIESVEISDDKALADFLADKVDEIFTRSSDANFTTQSKGAMTKHKQSMMAF